MPVAPHTKKKAMTRCAFWFMYDSILSKSIFERSKSMHYGNTIV